MAEALTYLESIALEIAETKEKLRRLEFIYSYMVEGEGVDKTSVRKIDVSGLRIIDAVVEYLKTYGSTTVDDLYVGLKKSNAKLSKDNEGNTGIERANLRKTVTMNAKSSATKNRRIAWDADTDVVSLLQKK